MPAPTPPSLPRVWNKRDPHVPKDAIYVGRPSKFGNPFNISKGFDRAKVIDLYRTHLTVRGDIVAAARTELRGKHLVCWCAPLPCHADVLLEIANAD